MIALRQTTTDPLAHIVDLQRFPIREPGHPSYRSAAEQARADLDAVGCSVIRGFFRPDAMAVLQDEARSLAPHAHVNNIQSNPYSTRDDPSLPEDHPVRLFMERTNAFVPRDHIPADSALHTLYACNDFKRFVAECLGEPIIHEYADPLAGLVLNVLKPGCQHPWHYDANEFIVSTLVQEADEGGVFEYCPNIRSPGNENYGQVSRIIRGDDHGPVRKLALRPGDLQLFKGRFALHRVTRVNSREPRISAIFAYAQRPGFVSTLERAQQLFGRTTPIHHETAQQRIVEDGLID